MYITGTGMVSPVGLTAASACAAKRAGISAFEDLPVEYGGEPIVGAVVPGIEPGVSPDLRLAALLARSLVDLFKGHQARAWGEVPLLVGLAEHGRPGGGSGLDDSIVGLVQESLGLRFHPRDSKVFAVGHTAGFEALAAARGMVRAGVSACVVACVDSLVNLNTLRWLDRLFRLKTPANGDGLIPGEAAAAVLLEGSRRPEAVTEVIGLGFGKEKAPILSEGPLLGLGLAEATRQALAEAELGLHEIDGRLSDVTGEAYGFKEVALVMGRTMRTPRKRDQPLWQWAEAIGDTGAAAGVVQLVLADEAFRKCYAPGDRMIGWTSAATGGRAAVVLRRLPC
jgi:3-oxoacyl-[acyl-carrier-protein] synthase-1